MLHSVVRRSSSSVDRLLYDTVSVSAVTGLVTALVYYTGHRTLSLALKLLRIIARGVCNHSTNFGVGRFVLDLSACRQNAPDASRDLRL